MTYELDMGDHVIVRTDHLHVEQTMEEAAMERLANQGKAWGSGQVIGRMPLGLYFASGLAEARKQGDAGFIKRVWNDPDYKKLRTFEGKV